jgi:hypothetical protein
LNTIGTPSGVQRVKGQKKGKKFVNENTVCLGARLRGLGSERSLIVGCAFGYCCGGE